jgi:hypothetical protein
MTPERAFGFVFVAYIAYCLWNLLFPWFGLPLR